VSWVRQYVRTMPISELFGQLRDLSFSFSLSDSLQKQKLFLWLDAGWFLVLLAFMGIMTLLYGVYYILIFTLLLLIFPLLLLIQRLYTWHHLKKNSSFILPRKGIEGLFRLTVLITSLSLFNTIHPLHKDVVSFDSYLFIFLNPYELTYLRDNFLFNLLSMVVATILIVLPWDFFPNLIMKLKNFSLVSVLEFLRKFAESLWRVFLRKKKLLVIIIFYILIVLLLHHYHYEFIEILSKIIEKFFFVFAFVIGIYILLIAIFYGKLHWQDYWLIKKLDLTGTVKNTVTEKWIYDITIKLRFNWWRYKFLDRLIAAKLPLKDSNQEEKVNIPINLESDIKVREKLAQLKEQWNGLNE
jgi:hypothetical protein